MAKTAPAETHLRPGERMTGASPAPERPADDVMDAVRESVAALDVPGSAFPQACYAELIALVPAVLQTCADHGHAVTAELTQEVFAAATSTAPVQDLADRLALAGARLRDGGFPADGYQGAAHAVLRAARDTYPLDWDSSLSSAWVAWLAWAGDRMAVGARSGAGPAAAPAPVAAPLAVRATLGDVFEALRSGPFAGNPRALDSVATRIALRTGADIRYPRLDQQSDPDLVATVLSALSRMGYAVAGVGADGPVDAAALRPAAAPQPAAPAPLPMPTGPSAGPARHGRAGTGTPPRVDPETGSVSLPVVDAFERPRRARWWNLRLRGAEPAAPGAGAPAASRGPAVTPSGARPPLPVRARDRVPPARPVPPPAAAVAAVAAGPPARPPAPAVPPGPAVPAADSRRGPETGSFAPVARPFAPSAARPAPAPAPFQPAPFEVAVAAPAGPRGTFDAFSTLENDPARLTSAAGGPSTLPEILDRLRRTTFDGNDWALDGVLTRVALRTGADIRAPRPDQVADPSVVRDVLAVLDRMGYGEVASAEPAAVPVQRPRWWSRQRRRE